MSGFAVVKKVNAQQKKFFQKSPCSLFVKIFKTVCGTFVNKWTSRYLAFGDFSVPVNCSSQQTYSRYTNADSVNIFI